MKLKEMTSLEDVIENTYDNDAEFRIEWDKTAFARDVAIRIVSYRTKKHLSQTDLAVIAGLKQPAIARLEAGDNPPSLATMAKLSAATGLVFKLKVADGSVALAG